MKRRSTAARLDQVQHNVEQAIIETLQAAPDDDLHGLIAIFDAMAAPRRKLAADQVELWRRFTEQYRRRYTELQQRNTSFISGA